MFEEEGALVGLLAFKARSGAKLYFALPADWALPGSIVSWGIGWPILAEAAGFKIRPVEDNTSYRFISDNAKAVSKKFDVKSVSLVAVKQG